MELTQNEISVLVEIIEMTMEDIEDEPWWPDGPNLADDDERYMWQKHEVCRVLSQKLMALGGDLDPKILQVIEDLTSGKQ